MNANDEFLTPEGFRRLLDRLHRAGDGGAWRHDAEAGHVVQYAIEKYGALARSHGFDAEDVAPAAIKLMRTRSVREAIDPWAVLTRAMKLEFVAEARGQGLLCSPDRARKPDVSAHHDAHRFGERDDEYGDNIPLAVVTHAPPSSSDDVAARLAKAKVDGAVGEIVKVFEVIGWPRDLAESGIEYICSRLTECQSRATAYEYLRRDHSALSCLGISKPCWLAMLRTVLGNQNPDRAETWSGRGALYLTAAGMTAFDVLSMPDVVRPIAQTCPTEGHHDD
ncbi:hypothetical protein Xcel_0827 [Xylanimonas cellulosilytica DSM 15894]|uniref:Uncharacterized protein n=1 Tax=Xylanimonas cellulosilytica (strain DSM 15894 / JCM 12276 / CECT 5975 / KCTC 9989 / LMG 20990 / NBRC 107835 / XIL07) TaxID=446471 RepID=D1BY19_XYLCX|nr:hypothetical protein [Xylanimonas cellulosilytica]ACZ29862.1 hypothetical protein Xcel_0827 [Xylanimonas cellulosilytica DSM 15894]